jgi:hypothetical protein
MLEKPVVKLSTGAVDNLLMQSVCNIKSGAVSVGYSDCIKKMHRV